MLNPDRESRRCVPTHRVIDSILSIYSGVHSDTKCFSDVTVLHLRRRLYPVSLFPVNNRINTLHILLKDSEYSVVGAEPMEA